MKLLQLLPIGDFDGRLLRELAPILANLFRVPTEVLALRLDPEFAYHGERQQFHSSETFRPCNTSWNRIPGACSASPAWICIFPF
jgi:hypothetical protein